MTAAAGASSELGYQIGIFQVICLCRRKKKYQLEERVVGEDSGGGGAQCEKEAKEEEVYRTKRSVVVKDARNHVHIESSEQRAEPDVDDDERIKAIVDKFKQNVENDTETNVTTQRCDVSAANDPLLPCYGCCCCLV